MPISLSCPIAATTRAGRCRRARSRPTSSPSRSTKTTVLPPAESAVARIGRGDPGIAEIARAHDGDVAPVDSCRGRPCRGWPRTPRPGASLARRRRSLARSGARTAPRPSRPATAPRPRPGPRTKRPPRRRSGPASACRSCRRRPRRSAARSRTPSGCARAGRCARRAPSRPRRPAGSPAPARAGTR